MTEVYCSEFPCMETVLDSQTSQGTVSSADQTIKIKAASAPPGGLAVIPKPETPSEDKLIKPQISAPSYLNSLRVDNDPPFGKPLNEPRPCIITGTIMNEAEAVAMIEAHEADKENGLRRFLGNISSRLYAYPIGVGTMREYAYFAGIISPQH